MRQRKLSLVLVLFLTIPLYPQNALLNRQLQVGFEEKQGGYIDLNTRLVNENKDTVFLKDILKKPAILNLVYYRCPGVCSPIMSGISRVIDEMDLLPGKDYQVLTISFDYNERINLAIEKKAAYLSMMKYKERGKNWQFFVSDSSDVARLTKSAGFNYTKENNQFVHPAGLIALGSDGKIIRYLRGIDFLPFDIKITLVEAARGKIGPSINRLLAVCYSYDQQSDQFVFNILKVSGIVILFLVICFFLYLSLHRLTIKRKSS